MTRYLVVPALAAVCLQPPAFKAGVDVVRIDASVTRGRTPETGLTARNFAITDNGIPQNVTSVELDQLPIAVTLVLDVSGSVAGEELAELVDAGRQLVGALRRDDRAALVTFSDRVIVDVPPTSDLASVSRALGGLHGSGPTSLNDAVHVALTLRPLDTARSVIIVFSDGADNVSWTPAAALVDEARHLDAVIHAIELQPGTGARQHVSPALRAQTLAGHLPLLQALALETGGRVWSAASPRDLRTLFTQALQEMRARYLLTYSPAGPPKPGWHEVKVSLKNARGDVTARPGYFVGGR